jgi:hypothetical protein
VRWLDRFLTMLPLAGQHDPEHDHRQDADQPDDADHPGACSGVAVFPGSGTLLECSVNPGLDELSSIRLGEDLQDHADEVWNRACEALATGWLSEARTGDMMLLRAIAFERRSART